jgi:hypothetical protein
MIGMSRWIACGVAGALSCALIVAGCTGSGLSPGHASRPASRHATSTAIAGPRWPVTMADARRCQATMPRPDPPSIGAGLFGWGSAYGNSGLWVGGLGPGGITVGYKYLLQPDGAISWKYGWWRITPGTLTIAGHRLDAPAPPLAADVPQGYGPVGFQASGVVFPTEGCWQITGKTGNTSLTFVIFVIKKTDMH